jgi:hypothetical protein
VSAECLGVMLEGEETAAIRTTHALV